MYVTFVSIGLQLIDKEVEEVINVKNYGTIAFMFFGCKGPFLIVGK